MPWAKIITIPGSRIMSSLMWVLSQAITTTACFPGILRAVYCSYCLHNFQCKLSKSQVKSYLRFICRVSNVCRPGGHRRSCAFSISSVTVWGVAIYMIKQCQVKISWKRPTYVNRAPRFLKRPLNHGLKYRIWCGNHPAPPDKKKSAQKSYYNLYLVTLALERVAAQRITSSSSIWSWTQFLFI